MATRMGVLRNEGELPWEPIDPASAEGDQQAMLSGSLGEPGVYSFRLKLKGKPEGGRPHWHPDWEFGTVLSGTFLVATGNQLLRRDAKRLTCGAFIVIPPRTLHATWVEEDTVLQIHGPGPRVTNYDSPSD
jgi:hypothetical protein